VCEEGMWYLDIVSTTIAERPRLYFACSRKVDVRLPGKGNANSHGARPVRLIITMIEWIRTSRLSIKNSLSLWYLDIVSTTIAERPRRYFACARERESE